MTNLNTTKPLFWVNLSTKLSFCEGLIENKGSKNQKKPLIFNSDYSS